MGEIEIQCEEVANTKAWQWVYRVDGSPIWNITPSYMSKKQFNAFVESHNAVCPRNIITDFRKVKVTKIERSK